MDERGFSVMAQTAPVFAHMAKIAGLRAKGAYTVPELSFASSVSETTLYTAAKEGRLKTKIIRGKTRGKLVQPDWFDQWWEAQR